MSKTMQPEELKTHCNEAISHLQKLLDDFSSSNCSKTMKRAMLLAYWIKTYIQYIRKEDEFAPQSVFRLKRGSIVRVEFGYRVGKELGGRHYAVVLDAENSMYRNTVTVVPLGSLKPDQPPDPFNVMLDDGIYGPIYKKVNALIQDANHTIDEADAMNEKIKTASPEDAPSLRAVQRQKLAAARKSIETAKSWINEVSQMKPGSVAKVDQITTISKMRISDPLKKTHPLYGVRLSPNDLDKIDRSLMKLYFPKQA